MDDNNKEEKLLNLKKRIKNRNISIYSNNELYENEFNKSIKEKISKNISYTNNTNSLSNRKIKLKTNYKTFTNDSKSSIELNDSNITFSNNKKINKVKHIYIKSPDLIYPPELHSYRGNTETQKKREKEDKKRNEN